MPVSTAAAPSSRYKCALPTTCIDFRSKAGQDIFLEALRSGYMNVYFALSPQFHCQSSLGTCAAACIVMAMNALDVDPGVVWLEPWRWCDEQVVMTSAGITHRHGVAFEELAAIATANKLAFKAVMCENTSDHLELFRSDVKEACARQDKIIVANFYRGALGQDSNWGHWSPIGGYCAANDMVLILDVARYRFPPYWVSLELFWKSMLPIGRPIGRGYYVLQRNP